MRAPSDWLVAAIAALCLVATAPLPSPAWAQAQEDEEADATEDLPEDGGWYWPTALADSGKGWGLEATVASGGDLTGSISLRRGTDGRSLVREDLHAGDGLGFGALYVLPVLSDWEMQFAGGFLWGAVGVTGNFESPISLSRYYLRAELLRLMGNWRLGAGLATHFMVRYNSDLRPSLDLGSEVGLRLFADYPIGERLRLGASWNQMQYSLDNPSLDLDANSLALGLLLRF